MEMKFTQENFDAEVLNGGSLAVVDFYADWCAPCKMMAPVIEELAKKYSGQVKIGKLNVDDNSQIAAKYRVMSIPTIMFFKNGEAVETFVGVQKKEELEAKIEQYK